MYEKRLFAEKYEEETIVGNKKRMVARMLAAAIAFTAVFGIATPEIAYAAGKTVTVSTQKKLDAALKERIIDRLWESETAGKTVILITHSAEDAGRLADKVVEL